MDFKSFGDEQKQRQDYQKRRLLSTLFISSVFGIFFFYTLGFESDMFFTPLFQGETWWIFTNISIMMVAAFWWFGFPSFFKTILPKNIAEGRSKNIYNFLHPTPTFSDELERAEPYYLTHEDLSHMTLFDFDAKTGNHDKHGTNRIISYFRDKKMEALKYDLFNAQETNNIKQLKTAEDNIAAYNNDGNPTQIQVNEYLDILGIIEGMLASYTTKTDLVEKADIDSPLRLVKKNGDIIDFTTSKEDVVKDGRVFFSIRMVAQTVSRLSVLFYQFIKLSRQKSTILNKKDVRPYLQDEETLNRFLDYFKFMIFRRLVSSYGNIASGLVCVRVEDYTMRAIVSAIDRPMIPFVEDDTPNGYYNSDKEAAAFLFVYWSFMEDPKIAPIIKDVFWTFNETKDFNEIKAKELKEEDEKKAGIT